MVWYHLVWSTLNYHYTRVRTLVLLIPNGNLVLEYHGTYTRDGTCVPIWYHGTVRTYVVLPYMCMQYHWNMGNSMAIGIGPYGHTGIAIWNIEYHMVPWYCQYGNIAYQMATACNSASLPYCNMDNMAIWHECTGCDILWRECTGCDIRSASVNMAIWPIPVVLPYQMVPYYCHTMVHVPMEHEYTCTYTCTYVHVYVLDEYHWYVTMVWQYSSTMVPWY